MGKSKATKEQRQEAVRLLEAGKPGEEVARKFGVSRALVYLWKSTEKKKENSRAIGQTNADLVRRVEQLEIDVAVLKKAFTKGR